METSIDTVTASDSGELPPPPAEITVPGIVKAKRRGRPPKVAPPPEALFVAAIDREDFRADFTCDDDAGLSVRISTAQGDTLAVSYSGPNDRTLAVALASHKRNKGEAVAQGAEFPARADSVAQLYADTVSGALAHLIPAMSRDTTRGNLCGVYLDAAGVWVATDGYRLHTVSHMPPAISDVIIPARAVHTLARALKVTRADSVEIHTSDTLPGFVRFMLTGPTTHIDYTVRLVSDDFRFPEWRNVVPSIDGVALWRGDAGAIRGALEKAPIIGDKCAHRRLIFADGGAVTFRHDKAPVPVPVFCDDTSARHGASYNARYLNDALSEMGGAVTISAGDEFSPIRIDNYHRMALVMPVRG